MGAPARIRVRFGEGDVFLLRIELEGITPTVWRRVAVSARASLHELHGVIQRAMERDEDGGYAFDIDGVRYVDEADDPTPGCGAEETSLRALELHVGARFVHVADHHGEPWHHIVTVEQVHPRLVGQRLPVCLGGERAAPPDDCEGPYDYHRLLTALREPLNPEAADLRTWLPENFDPEYVDLVTINAALARIPKHRPAA